MKSFKKFVAEVAQPKSKEEKNFKDQHGYEVVAHPVADPAQHSGDIGAPGLPKAKAKRKADQEGDANYDKAYAKKNDDGVKLESVLEEQNCSCCDNKIDEDGKCGCGPDCSHCGGQHDVKGEELSPKQKKIDHNKNGKIDGHDLAMMRKKKNEEVESVEQLEEMTFKKGPLKLKNGKQVMVSNEDAKALNGMFKKLDPRNKTTMEKSIVKNESNFSELLNFAKEAL